MTVPTTAVLLATCALGAAAAPTIEVASVPEWGTTGLINGRVLDGEKDELAIAAFILVDGHWWMKPYEVEPLTEIGEDGDFGVRFATASTDRLATQVTLLLLPAEVDVPPVLGARELPGGLLSVALARADIDRSPREIEFSGHTWMVKHSGGVRWGPGPNWFSDDAETVYVDEDGLHLRIRQDGDHWLCSEVICKDELGFGTYRFVVDGRMSELDPNVIAGFFTWDDHAPDAYFHEVDIEFGVWGRPDDAFGQYVVQPWQPRGNRHKFWYEDVAQSTHEVRWTPGQIAYRSWSGSDATPTDDTLLQRWAYSGADLPAEAGRAQFRINLWLIHGDPPATGEEQELVVRSFEYEGL